MKVVLLLGVLFCAAGSVQASENRGPYQGLIDNAGHLSDGERLKQLFQLDWDRGLRESPESATGLGVAGYDDKWTDMSVGAIEERKGETQWGLDVLNTIKRDGLTTADQLNYDLYLREKRLTLEGYKFPGEYLAVNQLGGVQQDIPQTIEQMQHGTVKGYENILARLRAAPALIEQNIELMKLGLAAHVTEPQIIMRNVPEQVLKVVPKDPMASDLLKAFTEFPATISNADRERLKREAVETYKTDVVPAYTRLHDFLVNSYIPKCRDGISWNGLPHGDEWYALAVREHTTTDMTPGEIHALGLSEVKRIRGEMEAVAAESGYKGDFEAFKNYLRTDPKFYYTDADSLLAGYRNIAKQIDPVLPQFFGKLPRLTYGVRAIDAYAADSAPAAYYMSGSEKAGRPGYFCANTSNLATRPKWQMEVLTLHESVPGHHLQISLAQEMENVPEFRKYDFYTAFGEGWALYCESLGSEMGFYKDAYSKYGQLTFEMWRACRLVIDTGIHSEGWTREQAINYLVANAGKDEASATVEIDRYIASPGQALAYKIGQLKFQELRALAAKELGSKFDIRAFHDELLANGSLPLPILEDQVKAWIANQKKAAP
jgi:uncharacterized protein (DUF885 family)